MKTLLLMRHATARSAAPGQSDFDRPLSTGGQAEAARMGRWLRQQGLLADLVISSSARRAVQTAAAVIEASGLDGEWQQARALYDATLTDYVEMWEQLPASAATVLIVAHNPGIEEAVTALTGASETMPPGALACVGLPAENWAEIMPVQAGRLLQVGRPQAIA